MRTAVTTTPDRYDRVAAHLEAHGLHPVSLPCIVVEAATMVAAEARAAAEEADWIVVTSARAVEVTWPDGMPDVPVGAVGPSTAAAVAAAGGRVVVRGDGGGDQLAGSLTGRITGKVVVFPHAVEASPATLVEMMAAGADVRPFGVYRTTPIAPGDDPVEAAVFASPSAVRGWLSARTLDGLVLAAIGSTTASALESAGRSPDVVPRRPDYEELARLLSRPSPERMSR